MSFSTRFATEAWGRCACAESQRLTVWKGCVMLEFSRKKSWRMREHLKDVFKPFLVWDSFWFVKMCSFFWFLSSFLVNLFSFPCWLHYSVDTTSEIIDLVPSEGDGPAGNCMETAVAGAQWRMLEKNEIKDHTANPLSHKPGVANHSPMAKFCLCLFFFFVSTGLLEHSHIHLFTYCLWLLSGYKGKVD